MKKKTYFLIIFNVLSILIVLVSFWLLMKAFFLTGFGSIFPLWGRWLGVFLLLWIITADRIKRIILQVIEGRKHRSQLNLYLKKLGVIFITLMIVISFWHYYVYQKYLQKLFITFFPGLEEKKVKLLKGNSFAMLYWHAGLVFSADQDIFNQIIKDYEIVSCGNLIADYFGEKVIDDSMVCYYKKVIERNGKKYTEYQIS